MQARLDKGEKPHFLPETRRIRESDWKVRLCNFILCCLPNGRSYDEDRALLQQPAHGELCPQRLGSDTLNSALALIITIVRAAVEHDF